MRVVFLDIDGVLVTRESLMKASGMRAQAQPRCVQALNSITDATGAAIVVSSTWRYGGVEWIRNKLKEWGVTADVIGATALDYKTNRGQEIQTWLANHPTESFVILDDDSDMAHLWAKLIQTDMENGLTPARATRAIRVLTEEL